MRVVSTLFVRDHRAKVGLQTQALMVSSGGTKTRVPLESLDAVVMFGSAQVTTDAIAACVERGSVSPRSAATGSCGSWWAAR